MRRLVRRLPVLASDVDFSGPLKYRPWAGWTAAALHALGVLVVLAAYPAAFGANLGAYIHANDFIAANLGVIGGAVVFMLGTAFYLASWSYP